MTTTDPALLLLVPLGLLVLSALTAALELTPAGRRVSRWLMRLVDR